MPDIKTAEDALRLMEEYVGDRLDFIYNPGAKGGCDYVRYGKPSCMVGGALALAGFPVEQIRKLDYDGSDSDVVLAIDIHGAKGFETVSKEASMIFSVAQGAQDEGKSWRWALALAREVVNAKNRK